MPKGKGASGSRAVASSTERALSADLEDRGQVDGQASPATRPESQQAVIPEEQASLCIKVPKSWRNHWVASAKLDDSNLTRELVAFLEGKYGLPRR